ncbi:MAG: hypothetical protein PHI27_11405 [Eubacteriales bacterium]|nr:hypothetical protein [Eubacteriales bacterium]MDD3882837.1 hypothetical protein [Eubacteriales bacterium]MDD4513265.1 hypothetical protein [Eubacteriales bacterium]
MKKLISLLLCLCLALCGMTAFAEDAEETEGTEEYDAEHYDNGGDFSDATNLYTIQAAGFQVALPAIVSVTNEEETEDGAIVITLAIDGREDCEITVTMNMVEEYAGLTMTSLSQEQLDAIINYYNSALKCDTPPELISISDDPEYAAFNPLYVIGKDDNNYGYAIYVGILGGLQLTVSLCYTAETADEENLGALLNTYIQFFDCVVQASQAE